MVKEYTAKPVGRTLDELQDFQDRHDNNFHGDVYAMSEVERLKHIHFHISKVLGHLGDYLEKTDHGDPKMIELYEKLKTKDVPDLFALSLILANITKVPLEDSYFDRMQDMESRKVK